MTVKRQLCLLLTLSIAADVAYPQTDQVATCPYAQANASVGQTMQWWAPAGSAPAQSKAAAGNKRQVQEPDFGQVFRTAVVVPRGRPAQKPEKSDK